MCHDNSMCVDITKCQKFMLFLAIQPQECMNPTDNGYFNKLGFIVYDF